MPLGRSSYHECLRAALLALAAAPLLAGGAQAAEYALSCGGQSLVLTCQEGNALGNCVTTSSANPGWQIGCTASYMGGNLYRMICTNAAQPANEGMELRFNAGQWPERLQHAAGELTMTTCSPAP